MAVRKPLYRDPASGRTKELDSGDTIEGVNSPITTANLWDGSSLSGLKVWVGSASSNNGAAVFHPTHNGLASGNALFSHIHYAGCTVSNNTSAANDTHLAGHRSTSGDLKTVTFNVVRGNIVALGGSSFRNGVNGKTCTAFIIGLPA